MALSPESETVLNPQSIERPELHATRSFPPHRNDGSTTHQPDYPRGVHTLASATTLLAGITDLASCTPLLRALGFPDDPVPLDSDTQQRLGLTTEIVTPQISRSSGELCALSFTLASGTELRPALSRTASRLSQRTPHLLWLLIAIADSGEIAIATWNPGDTQPRIAALVAHRRQILDSDAETFCALTAAPPTPALLTHQRHLELLGRQSIGRAFFRCLEHSVSDMARTLTPAPPPGDAANLALVYASRLIFLCFLETKGWLDRDHGFLANNYARAMMSGGRFHQRVLAPLFFGTLNTSPQRRAPRAIQFGKVPFLNGGLFTRSPLERELRHSHFTDESIGDLFANLLARYRFTAREDTTGWSEAAVDPEMLGKSFESLMASAERRTTGAFYTPQTLVDQLAGSGLATALSSTALERKALARALAGEIPAPAQRSAILLAVKKVRILDPACGSGAFLVHILEQLASLSIRVGDIRPVHVIRRSILTSSIFGVDINPMAVWLCELRLWLSMAIEDPERDPLRVRPLPNLDCNIRIGDSLSGGAFRNRDNPGDARRLGTARELYSRAAGSRKKNLARIVDRSERACAASTLDDRIRADTLKRLDLIAAARSHDLFGKRPALPAGLLASLAGIRTSLRTARRELRSLRRGAALPFSFQDQFADIGAGQGFDLVIGNPPWVRTQNFAAASRARLKQEYWVFRNSAWAAGAKSAAAARGFASQVDLAALFVERSIQLARPGGAIALLLPAKLWRSLAGGGVRAYLLHHTRIAELHDLSESLQLFDATVYPSLVTARRTDPENERRLLSEAAADASTTIDSAFVHRRGTTASWPLDTRTLPFDCSPGSPWLLLPPEVRKAFDRVAAAGVPLSQTPIGRPILGVKTGCNDAFLVAAGPSAGELIPIHSAQRSGDIERSALRPLLRGESITAWRSLPTDSRIIWTHGDDGEPLRHLQPRTRKWLGNWRHRLERRSDASGKARWWMLFRTDSAGDHLPRVVWADIGKVPRAVAIATGDPVVPLNTCYAARCRDIIEAHAFATLLNSPLTAAWLNAIAEPARGNYSRYLGWTMSLLPLPLDWERARDILAPIGMSAAAGTPPQRRELVAATLDAFRIEHADIETLMTWAAR